MKNYEIKTYDYIDKKTGAHVVKATTTYDGKPISAYSKCDPEDTFDLEFGTKLAFKRLELKLAQKRRASMTDYLKFCKMNLNFIEIEKRRVKKAIKRAEVAILDRKLETKELDDEITKMLENL